MNKLSPEYRDSLDLKNSILKKLHQFLITAGRFPHEGQARLIKAFFNDHKRIIQGQCGRSFGKTEAILYIAWRYALTNPGVEVYIVCPELAQGKRIYWIPQRLQKYGPQEFVAEHRNSELRTLFKNGSHIMVVGCENYEALRGIKPHLVIYDEFQHHTQFFDEEVMQPNLSSGKVSLVVMGTPPKRHCYYIEFRENLQQQIAEGNDKALYLELPSEENPTLDKEWLKRKKAELIKRGKINVWLREYMGKLVFDTESAIFPFFDEKKHVKPHGFIEKLIARDKKKMQWYALFDPGTATCFAGLFIAYNRYTSQVFILDEIYAKEKHLMTAGAIWTRQAEIKEELFDYEDRWLNYYDEAAAWFANEVHSFAQNASLIPTQKHKADENRRHDEGRAGESVINTLMMSEGKFLVSDRCEKFKWELENYVTDEQGRYPTKHDHLMDLLFYFINESGFEIMEAVDPELIPRPENAKRRFQSISEAVAEGRQGKDIAAHIEPEYFDYEDEYEIY